MTARAVAEPGWLRAALIGAALAGLGLWLLLPLVAVFVHAFGAGLRGYANAIADPTARSAIQLTLLVAAISVPLNTVFGVAAAWAIARFRFPGRSLLISLIDLPFAVSPVVSGLVFVLLFGMQGALGPWLMERGVRILFALPGIVLATTFVTFPFVARELIPLMEEQGVDEELAAISLGASAWQMLRRVTLPNIRLGLLYGIVLVNARAMGEFGAVSVVSGHVRGRTNTMPLHVEILYNEYQTAAAFTVASLLAFLAIGTLVAKSVLEWRLAQQNREEGEEQR
jgi:sulfate transport system permease protein